MYSIVNEFFYPTKQEPKLPLYLRQMMYIRNDEQPTELPLYLQQLISHK
jgi:hypothetical protein